MATDIAFAVGVLALVGKRLPGTLKVFLLTLALADDVGAIAIIAVFYSDGIRWTALLVAAVLLVGVAALRRARVFWVPGYVVLGIGVWAAFYESGVHATLAGVALGLLVPARPLAPDVVAEEWSVDLAEEPSAAELKTMTTLAKSTVSSPSASSTPSTRRRATSSCRCSRWPTQGSSSAPSRWPPPPPTPSPSASV